MIRNLMQLVILAGVLFSQSAIAQSCGDVITTDITLTADLTDCPDVGLTALADGITINLNGHTIDGTAGSSSGIQVLSGLTGVTIQGPGQIQQFPTGVAANGGTNHTLDRLTIREVDTGAFLLDVRGAVVTDLDIQPAFNGIVFDGTDSSEGVISDNTIENAASEAIWIRSGTRNRVLSNYLNNNQTGFAISGGSRNRFQGNIVISNQVGVLIAQGAAPVVGPSIRNRIYFNKIYDNTQGLVLSGFGGTSPNLRNILERNAVRSGVQGLVIVDSNNNRTRVIDNRFFGQSGAALTDNGTNTSFVNNFCNATACP